MADSGKKRKRDVNGHATPNKKFAHNEPSGALSITFANENSLKPVLAHSRGLQPPSISFAAYAHSDRTDDDTLPRPGTHSVILQSSKHPRLDYTAAPLASNDNLAHYIAIHDPDSNTLKIIPAHYDQLQCVLRSSEPVEQTPRKSYTNQRTALGEEFGTKKAKKFLASRTVNAITSTPAGTKEDVQTAILEEVAEQTGQEEVLDLGKQLAAKPIPQPNLTATAVEGVYPFSTLIPNAESQLLSVKEWQVKARAEENIPQPHRFTAYRVAALGKTNDIPRLKALRYVGLLLQFHDLLVKAGRDGKKVPRKEILSEKLKDFPPALVDAVRKRFSDDKNELGKWYLEKLHTHICALSLFIDQWTSDTSNIRDDLKLEPKVASQYFSELGCKVGPMFEKERTEKKLNKAQAATVKMARLKFPPEFPKLKTGRRK